MQSEKSLIETHDLDFSWGRNSWFAGINLKIDAGNVYGLLGRNGAGKTTLIRLLCGCLNPTSGTVLLTGGRAVSERLPETLSEIIYVPEVGELPPLAAVELGRLAGVLYPKFSQADFARALQDLLVPDRVKMGRLSFGQRRKVHIAFALATGAKVVFLDEPTNGLDIAAQLVLRKLLQEFASKDRALVVSTHHIREFESVLNRMIVLERGTILEQVSMEQIRSREGFSDVENWYVQVIGAAPSAPKAPEA